RSERRRLLLELVDQTLRADRGIAGNVVDRLLGIEFRALAPGTVEDVDEMGLDVEKAELEDREQADRAGPDDDDIGLDWRTHPCFPARFVGRGALRPYSFNGKQCVSARGRPEGKSIPAGTCRST